MRILDRERYRAYFKAYVICFATLVGLYIVIDAFSNFDEFSKRAGALRCRPGVARRCGRVAAPISVRLRAHQDRLRDVLRQ